jgi:hypothetical protein
MRPLDEAGATDGLSRRHFSVPALLKYIRARDPRREVTLVLSALGAAPHRPTQPAGLTNFSVIRSDSPIARYSATQASFCAPSGIGWHTRKLGGSDQTPPG